MKQINVMVTGSGSLYGVAIIKSLVAGPLNCRVIACDTNPMTLGIYLAHQGYMVPSASEKKLWLKKIIDICHKENIAGIFVGSSHEVKAFAEYKQYIYERTGAKVFIHPPEVIDICADKWQTVMFLKHQGFNYPQSLRYPEDSKLIPDLLKKAGLPLVAKPRIGAGSVGLQVLYKERELEEYLKGKTNYILQEYLPEKMGEYTVGVCLGSQGTVLSSVALKRNLQDGMTVSAVAGDYQEICDYCERIAVKLGAYGPCNMQLRIKNNQPYILEINPRFSSSTGMRIALGVNEAELLIRSEILGQKTKKPTIMHAGVIRQYTDYVVPIKEINKFTT